MRIVGNCVIETLYRGHVIRSECGPAHQHRASTARRVPACCSGSAFVVVPSQDLEVRCYQIGDRHVYIAFLAREAEPLAIRPRISNYFGLIVVSFIFPNLFHDIISSRPSRVDPNCALRRRVELKFSVFVRDRGLSQCGVTARHAHVACWSLRSDPSTHEKSTTGANQ